MLPTRGSRQYLKNSRARKQASECYSMKMILGALLVLLLLLQYEFWFSDGGMKTVWQLQQDIAHQQSINDDLAKKNAALAKDIQQLKESNTVIESHARNELGMVKQGEVFYQIVNKS